MQVNINNVSLKQYKTSLKLNQQQKNIIIGTLLGDSSLLKSQAKDPLFTLKFEQKIASEDYVFFLYTIFSDWCGTPPKKRSIKESFSERQSIWFKTYGHISFKFYADQFYLFDEKFGKRKKVVPKLIHRWLNAEALAFWFMDDGTKINSGYILNSQGFTLNENKRLANALGKNFKFEVNIHKDDSKKNDNKVSYRLYITSKSKDDFTDVVSPFILPCFQYKLHSKS